MRNSLGVECDQLACWIRGDLVDLIVAVRKGSRSSRMFNRGFGRLRRFLCGVWSCDILRHRVRYIGPQKLITTLLLSPSNHVFPFLLDRFSLILRERLCNRKVDG